MTVINFKWIIYIFNKVLEQMIENDELVKKPPKKFENGAIYDGEWKSEQRFGRGRQIWADGSIYEGFEYFF